MRKVMVLVLFIAFALSACGKPSYLNTSNYYHPSEKDIPHEKFLGLSSYEKDMNRCQMLERIYVTSKAQYSHRVKECMEVMGYIYKYD